MTEQLKQVNKCQLCGEPMPAGEEMFKYHGYSGDCPKPPMPRDDSDVTGQPGPLPETGWDEVPADALKRALTTAQPAQAGEVDTGPRVLREVFALCEDTMTKMESESTDFSRGRAFEAKGISRAIGTWFQDEFCGRSHMGEPVIAPTQPAAQATPEPRSPREVREDAQRARMAARSAGRTPSAATADFDLPAPNDDIQRATPDHFPGTKEMVPDQNTIKKATPEPWRPDVCPFTGLAFFMWIEHHKTGQMVPTYGGPYDSYTIPVRDADGSYCRERYDHDRGGWLVGEVQDVGVQIVSDQAYVSDEPPATPEPVGEPVGTVVHAKLNGQAKPWVTVALNQDADLPDGAKLFTHPAPGVPDVLFDGFAVLKALTPQAERRTSAENVSDVLDAVVRLIHAAQAKGGR